MEMGLTLNTTSKSVAVYH